MNKNNIKIIIIILIAILLIVVGAYYFINSGVFADENFLTGDPDVRVDETFDLDKDGDLEKISLLTYKFDDGNIFYLEVNDGIFKKKRIELKNFEIDLRFCDKPVLNIDQNVNLICVLGYVAIHSERGELIKFENNSFNNINFVENGQRFDNIIADAPNIFVKSEGEKAEICADSRNYEKDPLLDILRTCYILNDENEFELQTTEELSFSAQEQNGGKIQ